MEVGSSLAPHTALLMPFSGPTSSVVALHGLMGSAKAICKYRLGRIMENPQLWLQYYLNNKMDFSVIVLLGTVFVNPVTLYKASNKEIF